MSKKDGRLPDSFWHTVNRPAWKMGTELLGSCPTRAARLIALNRAGASKGFNLT